jgi:hypothetical protein
MVKGKIMSKVIVISTVFPNVDFPECENMKEACYVVWYYSINKGRSVSDLKFGINDVRGGFPQPYFSNEILKMIEKKNWEDDFKKWLEERKFNFT